MPVRWTALDAGLTGDLDEVWTGGREAWVSSNPLLARYAEPPSFAALLGTP